MVIALADLKVLVVEGNPRALNMLKRVFKGMGVRKIFTAKDGQAGLDFLFGNQDVVYLDALDDTAELARPAVPEDAPDPVDLIMCDWNMPRMTGLEFLQAVRKKFPDMPFMMATENSDAASVKAAKKIAVDAYLTKPYTPQECERKLLELIDNL